MKDERDDPEERRAALEKMLLDNVEKGDILGFRKYWSHRIFWLVSGILIFQAALVVAVGLEGLKFVSYQTVISVYLGESVVQVFGLGVIVLKFLFPKNNK